MNLIEASAYQDVLDAVLDGKATSSQLVEAEAIVEVLQPYLFRVAQRVKAYKEAETAIEAVFGAGAVERFVAAVNGKTVSEPRIKPARLEPVEEAGEVVG